MKKILGLFFVALLLGTVAGCANDRIIVKTEYVYIGTPKTLTDNILPRLPPNKEEYVGKVPLKVEPACEAVVDVLTTRTELLTSYSGSLLGTTNKLNKRLDSIESQDEKNRALVDEFNQKENDRVNKLVRDQIKATKNER